jgi:hypothetical protein
MVAFSRSIAGQDLALYSIDLVSYSILVFARFPSVAIMPCTEIICRALLEGKQGRFEQVGEVFRTQISSGADLSSFMQDLFNGMGVDSANLPGRLFCARHHRLTRTSRQSDKVQRFMIDRDASLEPSADEGLGLDDDLLGLGEPKVNVAVPAETIARAALAWADKQV